VPDIVGATYSQLLAIVKRLSISLRYSQLSWHGRQPCHVKTGTGKRVLQQFLQK